MVILAGSKGAFAQYKNGKDASIPLEYFYTERQGGRNLLSIFTFTLSTGYSATTFRHQLDGFGILQNPSGDPVIFPSASSSTGYSNWFNRSEGVIPVQAPGAFLVNSDTTTIGFKSRAWSVPLRATVHVEFDRYRIGGGYSMEFMHIGDFMPLSYSDRIGSFAPERPNGFFRKYFVMLGGSVYRYYEYLVVVDANIGGYSLGKNYDRGAIDKGMFINLGVTGERELSEYFKVFVRPSYEFKNFTLNVPEASQGVRHRFNAFTVNVGVSYRIPELPKCYNKNCRAQLNHAHGNREFRSRAHPFYKKQNPHYGENYPTLLKYKGRNKRKLNPY